MLLEIFDKLTCSAARYRYGGKDKREVNHISGYEDRHIALLLSLQHLGKIALKFRYTYEAFRIVFVKIV
jgi:hypothetical protein